MDKRIVWLLSASLAAALFGVTWWRVGQESGTGVEPVSETATPTTADRIDTDPETVFKRAFWARPSADDRILHAERREWSENGEVGKWQWFIEVEPSSALVSRLIDDNVFALHEIEKPVLSIPGRPSWFAPPEGSLCRGSGADDMTLYLSPDHRRLFATGLGGGFQEGAAESPAPPSIEDRPPGRFPDARPDPADSETDEKTR